MKKIDRDRVKKAFADYTKAYDVSDEKIRLKIEHTYKVADICNRIAKELGLDKEEIDLAWLLGMLHDVGRFEQLRQYGTFQDAVSINHGQYGADILFKEGKIRDYIEETKEDALIETAIRVHNMYRVPETLTKRELLFANILRDADKIDILRVNVETPMEEIYDVSREELYQAKVTPKVMDAFEECHTVLRSLKCSAVDHLVGHIALVFELVYPESKKIVIEQGYLQEMMNFTSENETTRNDFIKIRNVMNEFLCKIKNPAE